MAGEQTKKKEVEVRNVENGQGKRAKNEKKKGIKDGRGPKINAHTSILLPQKTISAYTPKGDAGQTRRNIPRFTRLSVRSSFFFLSPRLFLHL